jgi:hypothetical protein
MRRILIALLAVVSCTVLAADEISGRVVKVLPFFVDLHGQIAKSPSLFDRDAYQAYLRDSTNQVSAIRYDVLWKAAKAPDAKLKVRIELRGVSEHGVPRLQTLETNIPAGTFHQWTSLTLGGGEFKNFGSVVAWHATLWNNDQLLGEQKSFLW